MAFSGCILAFLLNILYSFWYSFISQFHWGFTSEDEEFDLENCPFILDENIDSISAFLRAYKDKAMDIINIKISKLGGITKSKLLRDLCVELGVGMTIEDSWGGDIATSAIAHLAHSTPSKYLFSSTDFNSYNTLSYSKGSPQRKKGKFEASNNIGLGIEINSKKIKNPVFKI